jgi:hypothetical protein
MLEATRATLRSGRIMSAAVIRHQIDALAAAGYRLEPRPEDEGAALMLKAARRAFRSGHFAPAVVVAQEVAALADAGHAFVASAGGLRTACVSFEWGPESFEACDRCGWSYWKHAEAVTRAKGAHRRD